MDKYFYISPLHIIEKIEGTIPSEQDIQLPKIRKKLSTILELEQHPELEIKGKVYNKSELLKLLDELEENKRTFHYQIFNNKALLNFLEDTNAAVFLESDVLSFVDKNEKLKEFVSPYFSEAYDRLLLKAIETRNYDVLKQFKKVKPPVTAFYESQCFQSTYLHITKNKNQLNEIISSDESDYIKAHTIKFFFKYEDYEYFQYLPSYLAQIKTKYAIEIAKVLNVLYNNKLIDASLVKKIYVKILKGINTRENINQIENLSEEFGAVFKKNRKSERVTVTFFLCLFGIIAIFFFIINFKSYQESKRRDAFRSYNYSVLFNSIKSNSNNYLKNIPISNFKEPSFPTGKDIYPIIFKPSDEDEQDPHFWVKVHNTTSNSIIAFIYPKIDLVYSYLNSYSNWKRSAFINPHDSLMIKGFPTGDFSIVFYTGKYWSDSLIIFNGTLYESSHSKEERFTIKGGFVSNGEDLSSIPKFISPYTFCTNCRTIERDSISQTFYNQMLCPEIKVNDDSITVTETKVQSH